MPIAPRDYEGPACPRCHARLTADWLRSGTIICPDCNKPFEATSFGAPQRQIEIVSVAAALTPEGANACANHARNAAVTSCGRCGLLICALCNMDVGTGPFCPSCFDRLRSEEALAPVATRYRDYRSMARLTMLVGLAFSLMGLGVLFGALSLMYARRGLKQLREEGQSVQGLRITAGFAILEIVIGIIVLARLAAAFMGIWK